jgi:hypothetical protein
MSNKRNGQFVSAIQREIFKEKETFREEDGWLGMALRRAARYLRKSRTTLKKWAKRCPYKEGHAGIETRELPGAFGNLTTYYSKADLDLVKRAGANLQSIPSYPDLTPIEETARTLGVSLSRVYQLLDKYGEEAVNKPARSKDGRALPRSYVRQSFVETVQADRGRAAIIGKWSITEAAEHLGMPYASVQWLIDQGQLKPSPGSARKNGVLLDPAAVKALKKKRMEEEITAQASPGWEDVYQLAQRHNVSVVTMTHSLRRWRKRGQLVPRRGYRSSKRRRGRYRVFLYEVAKVAELRARVPPPGRPPPRGDTAAQPVNGEAPPPAEDATPRRRGRKRSARTLEIGKFCYEQLADEVKRRTICRMIQERFQRVMGEPDVTIYARRYARDNDRLWPL